MSKYLVSILATAAALACGSASAALFEEFKVNETVIPGTGLMPGLSNPALSVGKLNGGYTEALTVTGATTFAASAFANFNTYLGTDGITAPFSLLNSNPLIGGYKIYALFQATGTIVGLNSFASSNNSFSLYLDYDSNTTATLTDGLTAAALNGNGEDIVLATAGTALLSSSGTGNLNGPPGAFNIDWSDFALTPFGKTMFFSPSTFFTNVRVNGDYDIVSGGLPTKIITGDVSANFIKVPEPTSVALVGLALLGAGVASRRSAPKK